MDKNNEKTGQASQYGFSVINQEGIKIFRLKGSWDFESFGDLKDSLMRELADADAVILSFKEISYINSIGITVIAQCYLMAQQKGIPLVLTHIEEPIKTVFAITNITSRIRVYQTENEAIKALT